LTSCRRSLPRRAASSAFVNRLSLLSSSCRHSLRALCCRATVSAFVVAPPLPSLSRQRCLHRRSAISAFIVGPPVLPSSSRCRSLHRRAAVSAFIVAPPLPLLWRHQSLHRRATAAFIIAAADISMVLPSSLHRRCLPCRAAAPLIVAPPLPSSSRHFDHYHIAHNIMSTIILLFNIGRNSLCLPYSTAQLAGGGFT